MSQQNDGRQHDDTRQQHAGAIRPYHILVATTASLALHSALTRPPSCWASARSWSTI